MKNRPLYEIAREIRNDWGTRGSGVHYTAEPYLKAMFDCEDISDYYGADSARSIVIYFLANTSTWRGNVAKRVKAELKAMLSQRTDGEWKQEQ